MTIGPRLKQARINKGISLQEASGKTKIQEKYLQALEDDNIAGLPNPIYAKGFLKTYAQFLGLDAKAMVDELEGRGAAKAEQVINLEGKELPAVDSEKYLKRFFVILIGFFVFVGIVLLLWSLSHRPLHGVRRIAAPKKTVAKAVKHKPVKQTKAIVGARRAVPLPKPAPKPAPAPALTATSQPQVSVLNLSITAKRLCRLSVKSDGKLLFEDFLLAGRSEQWQAKRSFELNTSDGAAIDLLLNGKRLGSPGKGPRENILITKDGITYR